MGLDRTARRKGLITDEGRECSKCGVFQDWECFSPSRKGVMGRSSWCHDCVQQKLSGGKPRKWGNRYGSRLEGFTDEQKQQRNRDIALAHHYRRRELVFEHYGSVCQRCGETDKEKLQLDHINDDGHEHRKAEITAHNLTFWVIKHGFPAGFQILCRTCNVRKGHSARRRQAQKLTVLLPNVDWIP